MNSTELKELVQDGLGELRYRLSAESVKSGTGSEMHTLIRKCCTGLDNFQNDVETFCEGI